MIEMEETSPSRGYFQLGGKTRGNVHESPVDHCNFIYTALMLAGVGFLLPYNSFIIAVDYFQTRFPGSTIVFDMSLVYILTAFVAVLLNNLLVETLSLNTRINFGYAVSFITLLFVATCEIWWNIFGPELAYKANLIAVAVVALGCTVQQSSFYGYTSMLPSRYTQAVMTGESAAGFLVSANRIVTKLVFDDQRANTTLFFGLSLLTVTVCSALHSIVRESDFVNYYIALCDASASNNRIVLEPAEDMGLMEPHEQPGGQFGVLKLQSPPPLVDYPAESGFSFSNPVYEPNAPMRISEEDGGTEQTSGPTFKVEDVVVRLGSTHAGAYKPHRRFGGLRKGLEDRLKVARLVWPYMLSIGLAYFVTLCLYPGIEAEITSCNFGSWMPVLIMAVFNGADLLGKILASVPWQWSRGELLGCAGLRFLLIPLLLLCAAPRHAPLIPGDGLPIFFSGLLGLTNGVIGSVPMIQAPSKVPEEFKELTGNIMTLSYNLGLALGSSVAYLLDELLGPPVAGLCAGGPLPTLLRTLPTTVLPTTTTAAAIVATATSTTSAATTLLTTLVASTLAPTASSLIASAAPLNATAASLSD
ncbi:equilibrative nucleoside transporter 4 [Cloeon dipterum]|uniref:equilibrative nucleoside transporter 4 n=1 Tax=Cloeon dipterum TaxID=197152 RepID=UPI00322064FF